MAIKGNVGIKAVDIETSDTTLVQTSSPIERIAVTAMSIHNSSDTLTLVVTLYESPNLTSASGKEIAIATLLPHTSIDITEVIGQGYNTGRNIIAKASDTGANCVSTVVQYTDGS